MKTAFLTEMGWCGKVPPSHPNLRTEFCWMLTLDAEHFNIHSYEQVKGYDAVFIIFPKAMVKLNAFGVEMTPPVNAEKDLSIYSKPIVEVLKQQNKKVCFVQEGPHWLFNDYNLDTQFHFYNQLSECDILFAHNQSDVKFYKGLFPSKNVNVIPTLMIEPKHNYPPIPPKQNKAIIGGNFARWYGGFQSYMVASAFDCPIYVPASHCKRIGEEQIPNLKHLQWVSWLEWMGALSTFKYAVNLMPTVAAGTFSMNCAYWGIPCIGNEEVDTQNTLFLDISVGINDIEEAVRCANYLLNDEYYEQVSTKCKELLHSSYHIDQKKWLDHMHKVINE